MRSLRETYTIENFSNDALLGLMNSRRISWGNQMEFRKLLTGRRQSVVSTLTTSVTLRFEWHKAEQ
tara:strand:- start:513 stop:710 length:198 start_codon:yes stop_codon:yes gene_type:complete